MEQPYPTTDLGVMDLLSGSLTADGDSSLSRGAYTGLPCEAGTHLLAGTVLRVNAAAVKVLRRLVPRRVMIVHTGALLMTILLN